MSREHLPNRRYSENFDINALGSHYTVQVGRYDDGRIGEVFIASNRVGSQGDVNARDAAVLLSLALQNGIPPEEIKDSLMHDADGNPEGVVGIIVAAVVEGLKDTADA